MNSIHFFHRSLAQNSHDADDASHVRRRPRCRLEMDILEERLSPAVLTVNSSNDDPLVGTNDSVLTLREAILLVNAGGDADRALGRSLTTGEAGLIAGAFGSDTIQFHSSLANTAIFLQNSLPILSKNVSLNGLGAFFLAIDGNGNRFRPFEIAKGTTVTLANLTVQNGAGGSVANHGNLQLSGLVVKGASAQSTSITVGWGGGVFNDGVMTITESTIHNNVAGGSIKEPGGGIRNKGTMTITNSTVFGNTAIQRAGGITTTSQPHGGGIYNEGSLTVVNSTIVNNTSSSNGGGVYNVGNLTLHNTIVAGNFVNATPSDLEGVAAGSQSTANLIGSASTSGGLTDRTNGNIVGNNGFGVRSITTILDPNLASNGGKTPTLALVSSSPAINAGSNFHARDAQGQFLVNDQRGPGFSRFVKLYVDIGSYEVPFIPDDYGDTFGTAFVLSSIPVGQTNFKIDGTLEVYGDVDVFQVTSLAVGQVQFQINGATIRTQLQVFAASDLVNPIDSGITDGSGFVSLNLTVLTNQQFYITVTGLENTPNAKYTARLIGNTDRFANNHPTAVADLQLNNFNCPAWPNGSLSSLIDDTGDVDFVPFTPPVNGSVRVTILDSANIGLFPYLHLYDFDGHLLEPTNENAFPDSVTYRLTPTTFYFFRAAPDSIVIAEYKLVMQFTPTPGGNIIVKLDSPPTGRMFEFDPSYSGTNFNLEHNQQNNSGFLNVGSYVVTISLPVNCVLSDIRIVSGDTDRDSAPNIPNKQVTVNLDANEVITVLFVVIQMGQIIVENKMIPGDPSTLFEFDPSYSSGNFHLGTDGRDVSAFLLPQTYTVQQLFKQDWQLSKISFLNQQGADTSTSDPNTGLATIDLDPGETIVVRFENVQYGHIIVDKQASPHNTGVGFTFEPSYNNRSRFTLQDGEQKESGPLSAGNYTITELLPSGWKLDNIVFVTNDARGNSSFNLGDNVANINLDAGETITVRFIASFIAVANIRAESLAWDTANGGIQVSYSISSALPFGQSASLELYWSSNGNVIAAIPLGSKAVLLSQAGHYSFNVPGSALNAGPAGFTQFLLRIDPQGAIPETNEQDNVAILQDVAIQVAVAGSLAPRSQLIIGNLMRTVGMGFLTVQGLGRTPEEQAHIMFDACLRNLAQQFNSNNNYGDQVIKIYQKRTKGLKRAAILARREAIEAEMAAKIRSFADPTRVNAHCADPDKMQIVDVDPFSVPTTMKNRFIAGAEDFVQSGYVKKFVLPGKLDVTDKTQP